MGIPEIESFRELLHSWTSCLDKAVTTALAFRADDGSWHLSRALTVLYAGELTIDTIYVRTNSIPAFRQVSMINRGSAESFMEAPLADLFMMTCGTETLLVRHHEEAAKRFQFYPFHPRFGRQNLRVCGLRAEVVAVHPLVLERSRLDLELAAHQEPYDGLTELLYAFDLNFEGEEFTSQTIVEWLVWPPACIDQNSSLDCAKLIVRVILQPGAEAMDVRVGLKVFRPAQPLLRRSVDGSSLVWSENKNHILGCYESSEYGETRLVKAFLAYRGAHLGYWWIRDNSRQINDRLSIHNAIDQVGAFRERFFEKENQFVERVAALLNLMGLTIWLCDASAPAGDVPDIIAMTTARHLFVIECTVGDIDKNGKLQRLRNRASRMAFRLESLEIFLAAPPLCVMITSQPREATRAHWQTAETLGISLVCREELENLLSRIELPPSHEQLYRDALSCIPSSHGA